MMITNTKTEFQETCHLSAVAHRIPGYRGAETFMLSKVVNIGDPSSGQCPRLPLGID